MLKLPRMPRPPKWARTAAVIAALAFAGLLVLSDHFASNSGTIDTGTVTVPHTVNDSGPAATSAAAEPSAPATAHTTTTTTGGDDGVGSQPPATATPDPAAKEAATAFTAAWLNTYQRTEDQWRAGILPRVTEDLAGELQDADPATVPAGGRVGTVTAGLDGQLTVADVQVVTDGGPKRPLGTLHLSIVSRDGNWLISEIDWAGRK
jgi:hypothetical protein